MTLIAFSLRECVCLIKLIKLPIWRKIGNTNKHKTIDKCPEISCKEKFYYLNIPNLTRDNVLRKDKYSRTDKQLL